MGVPAVTRIGHVGLQVPDLERSVAFAEQMLGLRVTERDRTAVYLTCNARHHELVLRSGGPAACDHLGLEVADADALDRLAGAIADAGWRVTKDRPVEPGIEDAVAFVGPGGFTFELFYGMARDQPPHYDTIGVRPRKFEHITVEAADKAAMEELLGPMLGFRLSDRAGDAISWWRCGEEHHGISVIASDADRLQHYAWQIDSWATIARTGDQLAQRGRTFLWGPGHHGIGDNYFCYFADADGVTVEYSAQIARIEDDGRHEPRTWPDEPLSVNRWGNPPPPPEFVTGGTALADPNLNAVTLP